MRCSRIGSWYDMSVVIWTLEILGYSNIEDKYLILMSNNMDAFEVKVQ